MALRQYHRLQLVRDLLALPTCGTMTLLSRSPPLGATPLPTQIPQAINSGTHAARDTAAAWLPSAASLHSRHRLVVDLPSLLAELPVSWDAERFSSQGVSAVYSMLPNRKQLLAAQFSPHGLTLVPKAILDAAATVAAVQEPFNPIHQTPIQAIGIKTWRRLKMKKHKIRKRRKDSRMQVKKN